MLFAYFGPETVLPLTSIIAGAIGVFMMVGRQGITFIKRFGRRIVRLVRPGSVAQPRSASASLKGIRVDSAETTVPATHNASDRVHA